MALFCVFVLTEGGIPTQNVRVVPAEDDLAVVRPVEDGNGNGGGLAEGALVVVRPSAGGRARRPPRSWSAEVAACLQL